MNMKPAVDDPRSRRQTGALTIQEAAAYLQVSEGTLNNLRSKGEGPIYSKPKGVGIRYLIADLDMYIQQSRVRRLPRRQPSVPEL